MSDYREIELQGKSKKWYTFDIFEIKSSFPNHAGVYIFVQKDDSKEFKIDNFKFIHIGIDKDLSHIYQISTYYSKTTHVLIYLDNNQEGDAEYREFAREDILESGYFKNTLD